MRVHRRRAKQNQDELLAKVNEETLRSLTRARESGDEPSTSGRKVSDLVTYRSIGEIQPQGGFQIQVWALLSPSSMKSCRPALPPGLSRPADAASVLCQLCANAADC